MNDESQAQNIIMLALSALNSQLEALAEEVKDCPEVQDENNAPSGDWNVNKSDSGGGMPGDSGKTPEQEIEGEVADPVLAQEIIALAKQNGQNLEDVAALLKNGVDATTVKQWLENGYKLDGAATLLNLGIDVDVVSPLINNKADLKDIAANAKILLDAHIRLDLVNGWLKNGTHLKDAIAVKNLGVDLNQLGTSSQVGDLTGLTGATPNEVLSRIPKDAKILPWTLDPGGAAEGMKFAWTDASGNTWQVRIHGPDIGAPPGSNAASGWVMRVIYKGKYMDASGNFYTVNAITNPASAKYDPDNAGKTHIPIQAP